MVIESPTPLLYCNPAVTKRRSSSITENHGQNEEEVKLSVPVQESRVCICSFFLFFSICWKSRELDDWSIISDLRMACGAAESGMNARSWWRVPATWTALNSGSDALPGWSSHLVLHRHVKNRLCRDINGIAIRGCCCSKRVILLKLWTLLSCIGNLCGSI